MDGGRMKLSEEGQKIFNEYVEKSDTIEQDGTQYITVDAMEGFVAGLIKAQKEVMRI